MRDLAVRKVRGSRKRAVVAAIRSFGRPFTTEQMFKICSDMPNPISRATLYRILRALRQEGTLKDVFLPHGQQVSIYTESAIVCVVECADCGLYANCPGISDSLALAMERTELEPTLTAVFLRSRCPRLTDCNKLTEQAEAAAQIG